jgi:hypothetical protein
MSKVERPKGRRSRLARLAYSPVTTRLSRWWLSQNKPGAKLTKDSLKKYQKKPRLRVDDVLLQMHEAMESVYAYDRDRDYVPNANELAAFDLMKREMTGHCSMLFIIVQTMHDRAEKAAKVVTPPLTPPPGGSG